MLPAKPSRPCANQAGFTLLELAMVLGIFTVLISILFFSIANYQQKSRLRDTVREHQMLVSHLKQNDKILKKMDRDNLGPNDYKSVLTSLDILPSKLLVGQASKPERYRASYGEVEIDITNAKAFTITHYVKANPYDCVQLFIELGYTSAANMQNAGLITYGASGITSNFDYTNVNTVAAVNTMICAPLLITPGATELPITFAYRY